MRGLDMTRSVHYPKAEDIPVARRRDPALSGRGAMSNSSPLVAPKTEVRRPLQIYGFTPSKRHGGLEPLNPPLTILPQRCMSGFLGEKAFERAERSFRGERGTTTWRSTLQTPRQRQVSTRRARGLPARS